MIYHQLEPFGSVTQYYGHAITSSVVANVMRGKGDKTYQPSDFMPKFEEKKPQSTDEMLQIAKIYTIALGGKDLRNKQDGDG